MVTAATTTTAAPLSTATHAQHSLFGQYAPASQVPSSARECTTTISSSSSRNSDSGGDDGISPLLYRRTYSNTITGTFLYWHNILYSSMRTFTAVWISCYFVSSRTLSSMMHACSALLLLLPPPREHLDCQVFISQTCPSVNSNAPPALSR